MTLDSDNIENNDELKVECEEECQSIEIEEWCNNDILPRYHALRMCSEFVAKSQTQGPETPHGSSPGYWMIDRSSAIDQSRCYSFECSVSLAHIPPNGCLVEEHHGHGDGHVVVSVVTQGGVTQQEEDVGYQVRHTSVHTDLMEHFANNTKKLNEKCKR